MTKETFLDFLSKEENKDLLKMTSLASNPSNLNKLTGSKSYVLYFCDTCGQSSKASIYRLVKGFKQGRVPCKVCFGSKIVQGINDCASVYPTIANACLEDLSKTSLGSSRKLLFKCSLCDETWRASLKNLVKTYASKPVLCPSCANSKKVKPTRKLDKVRAWNYCSVCKASWSEKYASLLKRGKKCPRCSEETTLALDGKIYNSPSAKIALKEAGILGEWNETVSPSCFTRQSSYLAQWVCSKDSSHTWQSPIYSRVGADKISGCPKCVARSKSSKPEKEILSFLKKILPEVEILTNDRSLINPLELDFYIPSKRIGVEFNWIYWHSTRFDSKNKSFKKLKKCQLKNVQLITIWEDDWRDKKDIIKRALARKLGASNELKVNARDCEVVHLSNEEYLDFLDINHIQGRKNSKIKLGLSHKSFGLVAVMGISHSNLPKAEDSDYILERFASNCIVRGGFHQAFEIFFKKVFCKIYYDLF